MLKAELTRQFDHRLTSDDKEEMKAIGAAQVAEDEYDTLSGKT